MFLDDIFGYDKLFDINGDGELDTLERAEQFMFIDDMIRRSERDDDDDDEYDYDDDDDDDYDEDDDY